MLPDGFVASVLAGTEATLDELIALDPCEAVRAEFVELGGHVYSVSARLDLGPVPGSD